MTQPDIALACPTRSSGCSVRMSIAAGQIEYVSMRALLRVLSTGMQLGPINMDIYPCELDRAGKSPSD